MTVREFLECQTSAEISEQYAYDVLRGQVAEEAEKQRALDDTVERGLHSIKQQVKR